MKYIWASSILIVLVFLGGCGSEESINIPNVKYPSENTITADVPDINLLPPLPKEINLSFIPLQMDGLQKGALTVDWKLIKTMSFGSMSEENIMIDIYEDASIVENTFRQFHGVLKVKEDQYLILDLSSSLVENVQPNCPEKCVFQRYFPGQDQYELIGSLELSANGPGRVVFIVNDVKNGQLKSFESWGVPSFFDLDADGNDEFVIEFPGLHMSLPDITIIRTKQGVLEISSSIMDSIRRNQADFATLIRERETPVICISNVEFEKSQASEYVYKDGMLKVEIHK